MTLPYLGLASHFKFFCAQCFIGNSGRFGRLELICLILLALTCQCSRCIRIANFPISCLCFHLPYFLPCLPPTHIDAILYNSCDGSRSDGLSALSIHDDMASHTVTFSSADDVLDIHVKLQYPGSGHNGYLLGVTMLETIHGAYHLSFLYDTQT